MKTPQNSDGLNIGPGRNGSRFSVVIPALNEEAAIGRCLDAIRAIDPHVEIIVADGGSTDRTAEIAAGQGAVVVHSPRGRGRQCNAGANRASGEVILFLHADTILPEGVFTRLKSIFTDPDIKAGTFRVAFDRKHWLLDIITWKATFELGCQRFGDSCITMRKDFFRQLGGFPDQNLFEDLELLRRACRQTRIRRFPMKVVTSARRFTENGVLRQLLRNSWYISRYLAGTPANKLAEEYESRNRRVKRPVLLMMVRYPEPGKVKSRLAAAAGDETAADIYRSCAGRLFAAADGLPEEIDRCLYCADAGDMERIGKWAGNGFGIDAQRGDGLGERLDQGFTTSFNQGAVKTVIVASDVPGISSSILREAFDALDRHDIVIGPSLDGGYYLIGLKRPEPRLFRNIDWSTPTVLDRTLQTAKECGLNPCVLPVLLDIDTADDWHRWIESQKESNEVGYAKTR